MIGVLAFASTNVSIEEVLEVQGKKQQEEIEGAWIGDKYVSEWFNAFKVSLLTAVGEFPDDLPLYRFLDWIIFTLCIVFNLIVLFNLLIAIVSENLTRIQENWEQTSYKEKVVTICHLQDTLFGRRRKLRNPNELIFIAQEIQSADLDQKEKMLSSEFSSLKSEIKRLHDELSAFRLANNEEMTALRSAISGTTKGDKSEDIQRNLQALLQTYDLS